MPVKIRIPQMMRKFTGGETIVEVAGSNVQEVIDALGAKFPDIVGRMCDNGRLRPHVNIILNEEDIRFMDNVQTAVKDGDVLEIIPAISGG
jgi:MoaD family protein